MEQGGGRTTSQRFYLTNFTLKHVLSNLHCSNLQARRALLLLRVDDVLFLVKDDCRQHFEENLKKHFKMSVQFAPRDGVFEFLEKMLLLKRIFRIIDHVYRDKAYQTSL